MDDTQSARLFRKAGAERWNVPPAAFAAALERSAAKAFAGREPRPADLDRYFKSLHLTDLALACACALGHDAAWDHFVLEFRPSLYRAADAIDPGGGAREAADALYAELYGLKNKDGARQSLFHYFHGRSSLATWLRSLLTQRFVDQIRVAPPSRSDAGRGLAGRDRGAARGHRSGSSAFRGGDATGAGPCHRGTGAARSPASRLLLCAGDDARADRQARRRARGQRVAPSRADQAGHSRGRRTPAA